MKMCVSVRARTTMVSVYNVLMILNSETRNLLVYLV